MLRGMGFDNTTSVYVAAGKIYKAEKFMAPLRQIFPRLETKDTLATSEELAAFKVLHSLVHVFSNCYTGNKLMFLIPKVFYLGPLVEIGCS